MSQKQNWESAYFKEGFEVLDKEPSELEKKIISSSLPLERALDLGCGAGRTSVFLAENGCNVDAVDFIDLNFIKTMKEETKSKVRFHKSSVADFDYPEGYYDAVFLMRLIMYLPYEELPMLFKQCIGSLKPGGHIFINYTSKGGFISEVDYAVKKYYHPIEDVTSLLLNHSMKIKLLEQEKNPAGIHCARDREGYYIVGRLPN